MSLSSVICCRGVGSFYSHYVRSGHYIFVLLPIIGRVLFVSSVRLGATLRAFKVTHCTQLRSMVLQASHAPPPMLISVDDLINKMQNVTISEVTLFLCYAKSVLLAGPVCH